MSPRRSVFPFLPTLPKLTHSISPPLDSLLPLRIVFEAIRLCLCGSTNSQRLLMTEREQRTIPGFERRGRILLLCRVVQGDDIDDEMRSELGEYSRVRFHSLSQICFENLFANSARTDDSPQANSARASSLSPSDARSPIPLRQATPEHILLNFSISRFSFFASHRFSPLFRSY